MTTNTIKWNTMHGMKDQAGAVATVNGYRFHRKLESFERIDRKATYSVAVYAPGRADCDEIWMDETADQIDAEITRRTKAAS